MARYVLGRVAQAVIVLWAAYTVTFFVLNVLPGDPIALQLGAAGIEVDSLTPEQLAQAQAKYGLDQPLIVQYFGMLLGALRGDFGISIAKSVPVSQLIGERLGSTLLLSLVAIGVALIVGAVLAYLAAFVRFSPARAVLNRLPAVGVSFPQFWVGLLLIQIFAFTLGWLPATGSEGWQSLILPAVTMAIPAGAMLAQVLTRSLHDTLAEPYITTARAKGLSRGAVQWRHAFRNAALPTLTILGVLLGTTVTSAIVVETVFSRNGIGRLAQESVMSQDIPVVQAIVVLAASVFVVINLIVDLLYPLFDPLIAHTPKVA